MEHSCHTRRAAVLLPSENFCGEQLAVVEPEASFRARATLRRNLGTALEPLWRAAYADNAAEHYAYTPAAKGRRRLRNVALDYIAAADPQAGAALAFAQFEGTDNMTDRQAALTRSEEHTSELQSLMRTSYAVFCLTKKKNQPNTNK